MVDQTKSIVKKPAAKKVTSAKKPVAKKVAPAKKPVTVKATATKPIAKKTTTPKPATKKPAAKKAKSAKKTVAKKVTVKKTVAKKTVPAKKPVAIKVTPATHSFAPKAIKKERNVFVCYANAFKRYFDFRGRTSRYGYWSFVLINILISVVLGALAVYAVPYIDSVYSLLVFIPSLALSFRRLHDVNRSGWTIGLATVGMFLLAFLFALVMHQYNLTGEYNPVITISYLVLTVLVLITLLYVLVLSFFKGTKGKNKYGEEPNI